MLTGEANTSQAPVCLHTAARRAQPRSTTVPVAILDISSWMSRMTSESCFKNVFLFHKLRLISGGGLHYDGIGRQKLAQSK